MSQSEMTIAINPYNRLMLLAGANTRFNIDTVTNHGTYYSNSAGTSWSGKDKSPGITFYGSDPSVGIDKAGTAYYNALDANELNAWQLKLWKSVNGGNSWIPLGWVPSAIDPDKNHITIDVGPSQFVNRVYIGYTDFGDANSSPPYDVWISKYTSSAPPISIS
ncbi:MAG: hypothetical protein HY304_01655 [candidate division Zixibacteria bacterium]|nr:hypothetical protein [candidate division Zixibacteria bacterium]